MQQLRQRQQLDLHQQSQPPEYLLFFLVEYEFELFELLLVIQQGPAAGLTVLLEHQLLLRPMPDLQLEPQPIRLLQLELIGWHQRLRALLPMAEQQPLALGPLIE